MPALANSSEFLKTILSPWYFLLEIIFSIAAVRSASRVFFSSACFNDVNLLDSSGFSFVEVQ